MIRVIVRIDDASMAANVGGSVYATVKTFDIDAPELEQFLSEGENKTLVNCQVIGVEVLP